MRGSWQALSGTGREGDRCRFMGGLRSARERPGGNRRQVFGLRSTIACVGGRAARAAAAMPQLWIAHSTL
jgi:hypothetical protein